MDCTGEGCRLYSKERREEIPVYRLLATILIGFALMQTQSSQRVTRNTSGNHSQSLSQKGIDRIVKEVHHELVLLPLYGVFDNLAIASPPMEQSRSLDRWFVQH